jgi:GNAT superfamily N-acetyltransferase
VDTPRCTLRPVQTADEEFLFGLYASTRREELAPLPWTEEQKQAFLRMQFRAQSTFYAEQFSRASYLVVEHESRAVGRLIIDRRDDEIRLIDIALLPENRGAGIGTALLQQLFDEATIVAKPVRIHVERFNPALRLYERLGFRMLRDEGVYLLLEWMPERAMSEGADPVAPVS